MTFDELRRVNQDRCVESFHHRGIYEWSLTDWATAVGGECGEALNIVKKIRRLDGNKSYIRGSETNVMSLLNDLANELADLIIYTDLLANRAGIDLGEAVRTKFNTVSLMVGSKVFL